MKSQHIGRHEILDLDGKIYGYEFLYRRGKNDQSAKIIDPTVATMSVLKKIELAEDINMLAGKGRVFINYPEEMLSNLYNPKIDPSKTVIEILESTNPTPEVIRGIKKLKDLGFKIALDDFVLYPNKKLIKLIQLADIIKVDIEGLSPKEIIETTKQFKRVCCKDLLILAERVETNEQLKVVQDSGYSMFQGFLFSKPEIISIPHSS